MDGNGRWARARAACAPPATRRLDAGALVHRGVRRRGIGALTLFAFSSENWRRPREEVASLMGLFVEALEAEIAELHAQGRARALHRRARASSRCGCRRTHGRAEEHTAANARLKLQVAVSYGGRWDIVRRRAPARAEGASAMQLAAAEIDRGQLCRRPGARRDCRIRICSSAPAASSASATSCCGTWPIRELYFTDGCGRTSARAEFEAALRIFAGRERRFGLTGEQLGLTGVADA